MNSDDLIPLSHAHGTKDSPAEDDGGGDGGSPLLLLSLPHGLTQSRRHLSLLSLSSVGAAVGGRWAE